MKKQFLLGLMAMTLPLTSWAQTTFTVTVEPTEGKQLVYAGDATKDNVEVKVSVLFEGEDEAEALTDEDFEVVSYHNSTTNEDFLRNAGTYTVTLKGLKAYRGYTIPTQTFTIEKAELKNLTFKNATKQYGDPFDATVLADIVEFGESSGLLTGQKGTDADKLEKQNALSCFSVEMFRNGEEVGNDQIAEITGKTDAENTSNYYYTGKDVVYITVTKRELTAILTDAESVYNGIEIELGTLTPTIKNGVVGTDNVSVSFTSVNNNAKLLNVGKYKLIAELDENSQEKYTLANNGEVEYKITKATLNISVADKVTLGKTYDGEAPNEDITTSFALTTTPANISDDDLEKIALKIDGAEAEAGNYDVKLYVGDEEIENVAEQTQLPNYTITLGEEGEDEAFTYTISKKKILYYFTGTEEYSGDNAKTVTDVEPTIVTGYGFVGGEDWENEPKAKVAEGTTVKNVGSYDLVVDSEEEDLVTGNYEAVQVTEVNIENLGLEAITNLNKFEVTPATMTITVSAQSIAFGEITDEILEDWKSSSNTKITPLGDAFKYGRAAMRVLVKLALSKEVEEANRTTGDYKGGIVVDLKSENDVTDADWKDLKKYGFNDYEAVKQLYANFGGIDKIKENAVNGDLTIGEYKGTIELDGNETEETKETVAEILQKYNGATVNEVKIVNLMNYVGIDDPESEEIPEELYAPTETFEAEVWYLLTLPFDVTVRELSSQLGYAIVNVPDDEKTSSAGAYFKLHMGTVEANTLMAFKVDQQTTLPEGLKFSEKKIVAPKEEGTSTTSINGVDFVGVYAKTTINGDNEWFMWPYTGKFTKAKWAVMEDRNQDGLAVYPFNGFVRTGSADARIYMEDADGTVTAVNAITGKAISNDAEDWYTVGGMKLNAQPTQKGVYINNGKKVVIK